jgi:hypothetical protein
MSQKYLDSLLSEGVTRHQFETAIKEVEKRCRYFPKIIDILTAVEVCRSRVSTPASSGFIQIEATSDVSGITPEEIERNKERIEIISRMLAKNISVDEAVAGVTRKTHIKEFKNHG